MKITAALAKFCVLAGTALTCSCAAPPQVDTSGMSFSDEPLLGKVVWNDLISEDAAAARRFYSGLFGWTFEETTGPAGHEYVLARSGGTYVAGLVPVEPRAAEGTLSRWLPYVSVRDVDAAVTSAKSAGGQVAVQPRTVGLGRVAAIIDPEGAVIGVARSRIGDPDDATTAPAAGRVVWTELLANDPKQAASFYSTVMGYEARTVARRGGMYTMLASRGAERAGILRNPSPSWSPLWLTAFGVADVAVAVSRAESLGARCWCRFRKRSAKAGWPSYPTRLVQSSCCSNSNADRSGVDRHAQDHSRYWIRRRALHDAGPRWLLGERRRGIERRSADRQSRVHERRHGPMVLERHSRSLRQQRDSPRCRSEAEPEVISAALQSAASFAGMRE
jgi:predicted enzyme related to lactoylglutathione lyase